MIHCVRLPANPALFPCSLLHLKGFTKHWNTSKLILLCQYIKLLIANVVKQMKTMVALVYVKTTATYTSIVMSDTYVACRTKWRLLTCAFWLPQMLDTYSWVDLSIWHKVNSLDFDQYSNALLYCILLLTCIDFCKDVCSLIKFSFFLIVSLNWMQWKFYLFIVCAM